MCCKVPLQARTLNPTSRKSLPIDRGGGEMMLHCNYDHGLFSTRFWGKEAVEELFFLMLAYILHIWGGGPFAQ